MLLTNDSLRDTHPAWFEGTMEERIMAYLTDKNLPVEVTDKEYTDLTDQMKELNFNKYTLIKFFDER